MLRLVCQLTFGVMKTRSKTKVTSNKRKMKEETKVNN